MRMGADECSGAGGDGGAKKRVKKIHIWSRKTMMSMDMAGEISQNACMMWGRQVGTHMDVGGVRWVCMDAVVCRNIGGHGKGARRDTNGCEWARFRTRRTSENKSHNVGARGGSGGARREIRGAEGRGEKGIDVYKEDTNARSQKGSEKNNRTRITMEANTAPKYITKTHSGNRQKK